ncbi:hypothetical protein WJ21_27545 [Burkholderia vietnamiensis]|uniref:PDDEXK-like family protein n=1 Tax=Burkholderia vietnamiensis TaxID=60552 RepID=UPI00075F3DFC|nr:PD-(D/E)XK nuclease family protein [Burkholderia vietnamiensis]KVF92678.1 hypothetical protein WJ21_27545 [Burkholderia vietnamiensis]
MTDFADFLSKLEHLPLQQTAYEPNFFAIGGSGYLENPTSDLLALFMGGERGAPRWLAKALIACLAQRGHGSPELFAGTDWEKVSTRREVAVWNGNSDSPKRLDLVISDGNFVLGVEHKVYAGASHNPFDTYDQLLLKEAFGGPVLKCVLRVNRCDKDVPPSWPVISYEELVETALLQYGTEVVLSPVSKWQFFYREFLLHLRELANLGDTETMSDESLNFAMDNFKRLLRASEMLRQMEDALKAEGLAAVAHRFALNEIDTAVKPNVSNWPDSYKALRYFPSTWGGQSQVILVYFPAEDNEGGGAVRFYVQAYIDRDTTKANLEDIQRKFESETASDTHSWIFHSDDKDLTWYESNRRLLALSAWARTDTKDGSMKALADLAMWVHKNAFSD